MLLFSVIHQLSNKLVCLYKIVYKGKTFPTEESHVIKEIDWCFVYGIFHCTRRKAYVRDLAY